MPSRSNSVSNMDEATPQAEIQVNGTERSVTRKDKGKGKEKEKGAANGKTTEEPLAVMYNLNEFGPPPVRIAILSFLGVVVEVVYISRRTKITVHPANLSVLWSTATDALEHSIFGV